jgi:hypothetical protein
MITEKYNLQVYDQVKYLALVHVNKRVAEPLCNQVRNQLKGAAWDLINAQIWISVWDQLDDNNADN